MDNVWVHGCKHIATVHDNPALAGNVKSWVHVRRYVAPGVQNYPAYLKQYAGTDSVWVDRKLSKQPITLVEQSRQAPANQMLSRHALKDLPNWNGAGVVNVKEPPFSAKGNNKDDDAAAIQSAIDGHEWVFLPKGQYRISKPLRLKADTKLFGLTNLLTEITCIEGTAAFSDVDNPMPLIETVDDADTTTSLQDGDTAGTRQESLCICTALARRRRIPGPQHLSNS